MLKSTGKNILYILFILTAVSCVSALELPQRPSGPVLDQGRILDSQTKQQVTVIAQALWEQAGFGLVVVTLPGLEDESIDDFANRLYEKWGIGNKESDEGALILISLKPRKVWVEVGYGAEVYLSDAKTGRLLDNYAVPYFKKNDFSSGTLALAGAIASEAAKEKNIELRAPVRYRRSRPARGGRLSIFQLIIMVVVVGFLMSTRFGRMILFTMVLSSLMGGRRSYGGGFGGGFGGGGFGGGFGGGMSGGGGAGRSF